MSIQKIQLRVKSGINAKIKNAKITIAYTLIMSSLMVLIMSFFITVSRTGMAPSFFTIWPSILTVGFSIGIPASFMLAPIAKALVRRITKEA